MIFRSDDPHRDFDRWDAYQDSLREMLPLCEHCGCYIEDEHCYVVDDEILCEDCMKERYRRRTEEFIKEKQE